MRLRCVESEAILARWMPRALTQFTVLDSIQATPKTENCAMPTPVISNVGGSVDMNVQCGADFIATFAFTNAAGMPLDLTGATFEAAIFEAAPGSAVIEAFAVTVDSPPTLGTGTLDMTNVQTAALQTYRGQPLAWGLKMTDSLAHVTIPLSGNVILVTEPTW